MKLRTSSYCSCIDDVDFALEIDPALYRAIVSDADGGVPAGDSAEALRQGLHLLLHGRVVPPGMNCTNIGLPGNLILSKRKGLGEVRFS